jgi:hypothetical protein
VTISFNQELKYILSEKYSIPTYFHNITKLYLSNNSIISLNGIQTFINLTHLSVSFNNLVNLEELDFIYNKNLITLLGVKGNIFMKNPLANQNIISKFPNLKDLDGSKIGETTFKLISETKHLRSNLIPTLYILRNYINNYDLLIKKVMINLEIIENNGGFNSLQKIEDKIEKIKQLFKQVFPHFMDFSKMKKYQKRNINPSIYVIQKMLNCIVINENHLKEIFKPQDRNYLSIIYERLFSEIIRAYTLKKNYNELPFFLNFLVLKSLPLLERFLFQRIESDIFLNNETIYNPDEKNLEMLKYICRNLDKLFHRYTNQTTELLIKLQMVQFFLLQPPQAKILSDYDKVLENLEQYELSFRDNSDQYQQCKSLNKSPNPFLSRLNIDSDILPNARAKTEFVRKKQEYEFTFDFSSISIDFYTDLASGCEKANLDLIQINTVLFLQNYSPLEFPVFSMNFDYMRCLTTIIQEQISELIEKNDKFNEVIQSLIKEKQVKESVFTNMHHKKEKLKPKSRSRSKSNEKKLINEVKPNLIKNYNTSIKNHNTQFIPLINRQTHSSRSLQDKTKRVTNAINKFVPLCDKHMKKLFFHKLELKSTYLKLAKISNLTEAIIFKNHKLLKRKFYFYLIKNLVKSRNVEDFIYERQHNRVMLIKKKFFQEMKMAKIKKDISGQHRIRSQLVKVFYQLLKNNLYKKLKQKKYSQSRVYYYDKILQKVFRGWRFYKHTTISEKKETIEEEGHNNYANEVYNFFHNSTEGEEENRFMLYKPNNAQKISKMGEVKILTTKNKGKLNRTISLEQKHNGSSERVARKHAYPEEEMLSDFENIHDGDEDNSYFNKKPKNAYEEIDDLLKDIESKYKVKDKTGKFLRIYFSFFDNE